MMVLPSTLEAEVLISLDGSGAFDGADDEVTSKVSANPGISIDEGRDGAQQLNPPKVQAGGFALSNERGQFSPERADSAYYQRLLPGRPVQYQAGHGERRLYRTHKLYRSHVYYRGRGVWKLGRHVIDDLSVSTEIGNRRVSIETLGYETVLARAPVTVGVMVGPRVDQCFTALLDAVSWPTDKRDIAISDSQLTYWWCDEKDPWTAMLELLGAEGPGMFGVRRDGTFYFENRNYRTTETRSTTSQATYWDRVEGERSRYREHRLYRTHKLYRGRTSGLTFSNFSYDPGFKSVYNRATYTIKNRTTGGLTPVWTYGANLVLSASQVITLIARPNDPFINAVTPALTTDYTVAGGTVSVSMSATSGLVAFITITATSGTPTVSDLQLRAQPLTSAFDTTVQNTVDASASIAAFSPIPGANIPMTYSVNGWPEIDTPNAQAVCNAWVLRQQIPRPQVSFTLKNDTPEGLEQILRRRPSDRVTLVEANSGLSADVWINSGVLQIMDAGGRTVELRVGAEVCDELTGAVWDESEWDSVFATWGV